MPHSTTSTLTSEGKRACPYCGRRIDRDAVACMAHRDLPALEPFDDRYQIGSSDGSTV